MVTDWNGPQSTMPTGGIGRGVLVATVLLSLLLAAGSSEPVGEREDQETSRADSVRQWWETAVVYQVYPRSFKDSDGDGVGDLPGITSKLEYLKDVGVGAVWLSPIYPSPQADFGYDISDFTDIDPQYGTLHDFDILVTRARELGLKVILDFVPNHSSDEHEWFKQSVEDPNGKYGNYYVWNSGKQLENGTWVPPNNWLSSFRGSSWEWNEKRRQFYYHKYAVKQPDLNFRNPAVVNEMKEAIRFWLKRGVYGVRVDAVMQLFEDEQLRDEPVDPHGNPDPEEGGHLLHIYTEHLPQTYDMVTQWRAVLKEFGEDRVIMVETYGTPEQVIAYYGTEEKPGASFPFNFRLILDLNAASNSSNFKTTIDSWMGYMNDFRKPNWVIGNHDQNRVGSFFRYGQELADGINMISLLLPGTAMTYNGEEICMDNTYITWEQSKDPQALNEGPSNYLSHSRDLTRTPFQWDTSTSAGFSTNKSTWLPVNPNYWRVNAKAQMEAEHSHLKMYKALLEARKKPAVQSSNYSVNTVQNVFVLTRELTGEDTFTVVVNLDSQEININLADLGPSRSLNVWTSSVHSTFRPGDTVPSTITLRPKEGLVLTTGLVPFPPSPTMVPTTVTAVVPTKVPTTVSTTTGSAAIRTATLVTLLMPILARFL